MLLALLWLGRLACPCACCVCASTSGWARSEFAMAVGALAHVCARLWLAGISAPSWFGGLQDLHHDALYEGGAVGPALPRCRRYIYGYDQEWLYWTFPFRMRLLRLYTKSAIACAFAVQRSINQWGIGRRSARRRSPPWQKVPGG